MQVNVYLKNQLRRLRRPIPFDFGKLRVKGRGVLGNIVTKNQVERISRIMPSAAGESEGEEGTTTETPISETPVGTLSSLLNGSSAPPAPAAEAAATEAPAPAPNAADEQQALDDSIHEQMGFEF